jgi:hypothetical protein
MTSTAVPRSASASAPKPGTAITTTGSNSAIARMAAIQPGFAYGMSSAG